MLPDIDEIFLHNYFFITNNKNSYPNFLKSNISKNMKYFDFCFSALSLPCKLSIMQKNQHDKTFGT